MKKRTLRLGALAFLCVLSLVLSSASADAGEKTDKKSFVWGVNGHNPDFHSYARDMLDKQLAKAAEMGATGYRINVTPAYDEAAGTYDYSYLDEVVATAEKYGLEIFLVANNAYLDDDDHDPSWYYDRSRDLAARYKGKIAYYQLSNEQDNRCGLPNSDGTDPFNYFDIPYKKIFERMKAMAEGLRAGDENAKRVVNIAYRHTGFLQKLAEDGLEWEVNALDWYGKPNDPVNRAEATEIMNILSAMPQPEIVIAEANHADGTKYDSEQDQLDYLLEDMNFYYNGPWPKLTGYYIYELLNQPQHADWLSEAHFGLIECTEWGADWRDKLAFAGVKDQISKYKAELFFETWGLPLAAGGVLILGGAAALTVLFVRRKKRKARKESI